MDYKSATIKLSEDGNEWDVAVRWDGHNLYGEFCGDVDTAYALVDALKRYNINTVATKADCGYKVELITKSLTRIKNDVWIKQLRSVLIEFMRNIFDKYSTSKKQEKRKILDELARIKSIYKLIAPKLDNTLILRGIEFNVTIFPYRPMVKIEKRFTSKHLLDRIIKTLTEFGLEQGKHFSVYKTGRMITVHITVDGIRKIYKIAKRGDADAIRFINKLVSIVANYDYENGLVGEYSYTRLLYNRWKIGPIDIDNYSSEDKQTTNEANSDVSSSICSDIVRRYTFKQVGANYYYSWLFVLQY